MSYKCKICGINDVDREGDVCELCAIGQDPYAQSAASGKQTPQPASAPQNGSAPYASKPGSGRRILLNGGASLARQDPYGNDLTEPAPDPTVQVYSAGQGPQTLTQSAPPASVPQQNADGSLPLSTGIVKNLNVDEDKRPFIAKLFRTLFTGVPLALDDSVVRFQVFPDYSGTALNALGNACDQVVLYGKVSNGAICENNEVEVYGRRASDNSIIAKRICNKASGTTVTPEHALGANLVRVLAVILLGLLVSFAWSLGIEGIIWIVILILCLTNLPLVLKILGAAFGAVFSILKRLFR